MYFIQRCTKSASGFKLYFLWNHFLFVVILRFVGSDVFFVLFFVALFVRGIKSHRNRSGVIRNRQVLQIRSNNIWIRPLFSFTSSVVVYTWWHPVKTEKWPLVSIWWKFMQLINTVKFSCETLLITAPVNWSTNKNERVGQHKEKRNRKRKKSVFLI